MISTTMKANKKHDRIGLGLAISGALLKPGERRSQRELAAFCDCSYQWIQQLESRALRKCRIKMNENGNREYQDSLYESLWA